MVENSTAQQILNATEKVMADQGVHALSMQKIAKQAKLSVGTLYIHFQSKEVLLNELGKYLFMRIDQALSENHDPNLPLFEQYANMWWSLWRFLQKNHYVLKNIHQYTHLPGFSELVKACSTKNENPWNSFVAQCRANHVICDLPTPILFSLTLETAMKLALRQIYLDESYSEEMLNTVVKRSWASITLAY